MNLIWRGLVIKEFYVNDYGNQIIDFTKSVYFQMRQIKYNEAFPNDKNLYPGKYIIDIAKSSVLLEPKSTEHAVYCNKSKNWEPIILLSSMFKIETKEIIK